MKFIKSLLVLVGLLFAVSAQAQFTTSPTVGTFTNVPAYVETTGVSNVLAQIQIAKDANVTVIPYFAGTNSGTATLTFKFQLSADGTTWTTTPVEKTVAMNGTTGVVGTILLKNQTDLQGVKYLRLYQITNAHTASVYVTNVTYSFWK